MSEDRIKLENSKKVAKKFNVETLYRENEINH